VQHSNFLTDLHHKDTLLLAGLVRVVEGIVVRQYGGCWELGRQVVLDRPQAQAFIPAVDELLVLSI